MSFTTSTSSKLTTGRHNLLSSPSNLRMKSRSTPPSFAVNANQKTEMEIPKAVIAASMTASLVAPEFAMATSLTPTVEALLKSVTAGGIIAALIVGAVTLVAGFDPITRK